ncbi:uncharacterized protein CLUP02_08112 [Colletotrichum lupini]|uniref:Uncharacterized protein n=1 Tax=Colletotrichum lupini TaxID=145971 RepID=A0A9Q8SU66_9PEZI|nr:uncharacterized protein CLUP02_08112 [Colletotrichum lupini]UQC82622.1 hypothetical protein CLUP02_08112 [Colletotrichum lupini]
MPSSFSLPSHTAQNLSPWTRPLPPLHSPSHTLTHPNPTTHQIAPGLHTYGSVLPSPFILSPAAHSESGRWFIESSPFAPPYPPSHLIVASFLWSHASCENLRCAFFTVCPHECPPFSTAARAHNCILASYQIPTSSSLRQIDLIAPTSSHSLTTKWFFPAY